MYYTHPGYRTSIFGKNRAYYIRIFTAHKNESTHSEIGLQTSDQLQKQQCGSNRQIRLKQYWGKTTTSLCWPGRRLRSHPHHLARSTTVLSTLNNTVHPTRLIVSIIYATDKKRSFTTLTPRESQYHAHQKHVAINGTNTSLVTCY